MDLFSIFRKSRSGRHKKREIYCRNCQADLMLQKGFDRSLPYWICKGCGQMLINPRVEAEDDVVWICDGCHQMLNIQPGFEDAGGEWTCLSCGYRNILDASNIYLSEDEYDADQRNPYKGLRDAEVLALSEYAEEALLQDREDVILVRHMETGQMFVKKLLTTYDKSIYEYLKLHPLKHMPRIREVFEGDHSLIVIEEYIKGKTVEERMKEGLDVKQAVSIAKDICKILDTLHHLPIPIIHRDIKPSNIIVTEEGETYLLDMNAAKWYDPLKNDDTTYMGTQFYAAPEQAGFGMRSSTGKTDVYAVGMLLNVMITGCFPKEKRATGDVWNVIERCICMEAEQRYTAAELLHALEGIEMTNE